MFPVYWTKDLLPLFSFGLGLELGPGSGSRAWGDRPLLTPVLSKDALLVVGLRLHVVDRVRPLERDGLAR